MTNFLRGFFEGEPDGLLDAADDVLEEVADRVGGAAGTLIRFAGELLEGDVGEPEEGQQ